MELLPSGRQPIFQNRVGWARTYLTKAGLLEHPRRGYIRISERGRNLLASNPQSLDNRSLSEFPEFIAFHKRVNLPGDTEEEAGLIAVNEPDSRTPEEALEESCQQLREDLAAELLARVKAESPSFFEHLVVQLLVRMGYGGSLKDAGQARQQTADEGIDGIIKEDKLGLDVIYIQAKRWENVVGRPEIMKFVGALHGQRARKGVFITTSTFSREARDYVRNIENKIILIDGRELASYMIDHNVGVTTQAADPQ